jgi:hypothetical protein
VTVQVVDVERAKEEGGLRCSRRCHRGAAARWKMSFAPAKCFSADRHTPCGVAIHLMKTEEPIGVIAGLKPATGSAWTPHRRLQTDSVEAAEGRRRNAFVLTMALSCTGVTSTLPVVVTKDIVAGVVAVPHGWATTAPAAGRWPTAQAGTSIA